MNLTLPMTCPTSNNFSTEQIFNKNPAPDNAADLDVYSKIDFNEDLEGGNDKKLHLIPSGRLNSFALEGDHYSNFGLYDDEDISAQKSFQENSCNLKYYFSV
jgi:hypothetical protein